MSVKRIGMIGLTALMLMAPQAFALTTESAPVDSKGVQLADPDEKFEDSASQPASNGSAMNFNAGDATFSVWNGNGQSGGNDQNAPAPGVQTGDQMFDPAMHMNGRH